MTKHLKLATPFAVMGAAVMAMGYRPIPVMPNSKSPGEMSLGEWREMHSWHEFRDKEPGPFHLSTWGKWEAANVGVILGNEAAEGWEVGALDFDTDDHMMLEIMQSAVPESPVQKRGRRGYTAFYLFPAGTKGRRFKRNLATVCEILTGNGTRQTVIPPSIHPDTGQPYDWVTRETLATMPAINLPRIDEEMLERFVDTVESLSDVKEAVGAPWASTEEGSPHNLVNTAALHRLNDWVPKLGLAKCKPTGAGFVAVPHWRSNRKGWGIEQRTPSLGFASNGIRDFSADKPHSALDVVMMANGWDLDTAYTWLAPLVGCWHEDDGEGWNFDQAVKASEEPAFDPETGEILDEAPQPKPDDDDLTLVPGLVGDIVDWIVRTSRQPSRTLALGAAITIVGTLMGRRVAGPTQSGTHLYIIALAPSGAGKDHALRRINPLMKAANAGHLNGPGDFMSMSAVISTLKRAPLCVCAMDEFGAYVSRISHAKASPHEKAITKVFREAWGASFASMQTPEYAGKQSEELNSPALSLYGVSTPGEFFEALQGADVVNGFINRFLMITTDEVVKDQEPELDKFTVPDRLRRSLLDFYAAASRNQPHETGLPDELRPAIEMKWGEGTKDCFGALKDEIGRLSANEEATPFYARTAEMAVRLATIRAAGIDIAGTISAEDIQWGGNVALKSAHQMVEKAGDFMSANQFASHGNRIVRFLKKTGKAATRREINRSVRGELKVKDLTDVLDSLVEAERIFEKKPKPVAGKPQGTSSYIINTTYEG